jgi:hypothetical protein
MESGFVGGNPQQAVGYRVKSISGLRRARTYAAHYDIHPHPLPLSQWERGAGVREMNLWDSYKTYAVHNSMIILRGNRS